MNINNPVLPQGHNPRHTVTETPTEEETAQYEKDLEEWREGKIPRHVQYRIARYEYLYTKKRDK